MRMITSSLMSIVIGWEDMTLSGHKDSRNLGNSDWDQKLGMRECVFSLYDKMRWKWDDVYLPWGLLNIYSQSLSPPLLPSDMEDVHGGRDRVPLEMHWETLIEWTERCTWRPSSCQVGDLHGGRDHANLEMHLEAVIGGFGIYSCRPWLIKIGGVLGRNWSWGCTSVKIACGFRKCTPCNDHSPHSPLIIETT